MMAVTVSQIEAGTIKPQWLEERAEIDLIVPPEARIWTPISVLHPDDWIDGSSYMDLFNAAQDEVANGATRMIIDLGSVEGISGAGVLGLYLVGALLEGDSVAELEGYELMGRMGDDIDGGRAFSGAVIAAASDGVTNALNATGLDVLFTQFAHIDDAITAFSNGDKPPA